MVTAAVHNSLQLRWWLRGFGAAVEVVEPAELREEFRQDAENLARRYAGDSGVAPPG
jgi:predicted DNA-binding transcriptional regulator YafY